MWLLSLGAATKKLFIIIIKKNVKSVAKGRETELPLLVYIFQLLSVFKLMFLISTLRIFFRNSKWGSRFCSSINFFSLRKPKCYWFINTCKFLYFVTCSPQGIIMIVLFLHTFLPFLIFFFFL